MLLDAIKSVAKLGIEVGATSIMTTKTVRLLMAHESPLLGKYLAIKGLGIGKEVLETGAGEMLKHKFKEFVSEHDLFASEHWEEVDTVLPVHYFYGEPQDHASQYNLCSTILRAMPLPPDSIIRKPILTPRKRKRYHSSDWPLCCWGRRRIRIVGGVHVAIEKFKANSHHV